MSRRKRVYKLFAAFRGGGFTTKTEHYSRGSHQWIYEVKAVSIKQAYYLASQEEFAEDASSVGIRKLERAWWHGGREPKAGDVAVAPYLRTDLATSPTRLYYAIEGDSLVVSPRRFRGAVREKQPPTCARRAPRYVTRARRQP